MSQRRSKDELRGLLLQAGLRVLYRRGMRASASHVPMTEATAELAKTHSITVGMGSIFGRGRLWANVGEYNLDLLKAAVEDPTAGGPNDQSLELIHHLPDITDQPYEERVNTLIELCRIAGTLNGYVTPEPSKGRTWELWVNIWATAANDTAAGDYLKPALRHEERRTIDSFVAVYEVMVTKLGLRPRAPYTMANLATLAAAVTDGIALRAAVTPETIGTALSPHSSSDWTVLGIGLTAIALEILEDDR